MITIEDIGFVVLGMGIMAGLAITFGSIVIESVKAIWKGFTE